MSSFDTNSGAPIVPERRRYYCDEELLSYRDTTPAFTRTARGAIAGEASTSVSPMQHTHTLKGGRSAYRHFKFGYLTGTKHFADSESALRGGPYGWTKERQQQMDKLAEEEASRAGASVAANTTSLHAAGLGYGVNHDCHGAYLAMDRKPRQALPRPSTTFHRTSRGSAVTAYATASQLPAADETMRPSTALFTSGTGRFVNTASIPPPAPSGPGGTARFPPPPPFASANLNSSHQQLLLQRCQSQRATLLAAPAVDDALLQLPAGAGYGDRHMTHHTYAQRPADLDWSGADAWAAGAVARAPPAGLASSGVPRRTAYDRSAAEAVERARARAQNIGGNKTGVFARPAGKASADIHVDAPMLRFSKPGN